MKGLFTNFIILVISIILLEAKVQPRDSSYYQFIRKSGYFNAVRKRAALYSIQILPPISLIYIVIFTIYLLLLYKVQSRTCSYGSWSQNITILYIILKNKGYSQNYRSKPITYELTAIRNLIIYKLSMKAEQYQRQYLLGQSIGYKESYKFIKDITRTRLFMLLV